MRRGDAKITRGYRLPARHVIHTVGPVWHGGDAGEPNCWPVAIARCLELAEAHELATIAFPSISTGIYRFPIERAAAIAVSTVRASLPDAPSVSDVIFCCYSDADLAIYQTELAR